MGNGVDMDSAKANEVINEILNGLIGRDYAITVTNGAQVLEKMRKLGYVDTPTVKYGCVAAVFKGIYSHLESVYSKHSNPELIGTTDYVDFSQVEYHLAIHLGAPDLSNPDWFFDRALDFWKRWNKLNQFVNPTFKDNFKLKIIGLWQPLESLSHIWPQSTIVPFEKVEEYYNKNGNNVSSISENDDTIFDVEDVLIEKLSSQELPFANLN